MEVWTQTVSSAEGKVVENKSYCINGLLIFFSSVVSSFTTGTEKCHGEHFKLWWQWNLVIFLFHELQDKGE